MLKYIVIWLCIGYIISGITFYKMYHFDVNEYMAKLNMDNDVVEAIRRSKLYTQIFVGAVIIISTIVWPHVICNWFRSSK